ncbi:MAG TPA: CDP-alcohol phosphatidyltransferase family protein [Candidatus Kryptonia bacterium]|nr:CDP-alcohol phosphatidyltransferase family protein [Candidatus Kryptonia bacterium]
MNTALILPPTGASFRRIAGLPLIQRTVLSALRSGFERVVVMPGDDAARLQVLLGRDRRSQTVELANETPAHGIREGQVAVLPSDCLMTAATLNRVYDTRLNGRPVLFTGASDAETVVLCSAAALAQLDGALQSDAAARTLHVRALGATDASLNGELCARVTDDGSAQAAEARLLAQLRRETAATDGPLARLDRFVSQWITRRLVDTPLRPNHITVIGTAVGLLAAWGLAQGTYAINLIGALLFVCATIIDGCDGEVARLKFLETPFGQRFDVVTDNIVHVAIFIALGLGQYRRHLGGDYTALITLLLGGVACAAAVGYWCVLRRPESAGANATPRTTRGRIRARLLRGFEAVMNRDFAYLILLLAVVDRLHWFLWGAAFGTYGFAAALLWVYRWRDAT